MMDGFVQLSFVTHTSLYSQLGGLSCKDTKVIIVVLLIHIHLSYLCREARNSRDDGRSVAGIESIFGHGV